MKPSTNKIVKRADRPKTNSSEHEIVNKTVKDETIEDVTVKIRSRRNMKPSTNEHAKLLNSQKTKPLKD